MLRLENEFLSARINPVGAELSSLIKKTRKENISGRLSLPYGDVTLRFYSLRSEE